MKWISAGTLFLSSALVIGLVILWPDNFAVSVRLGVGMVVGVAWIVVGWRFAREGAAFLGEPPTAELAKVLAVVAVAAMTLAGAIVAVEAAWIIWTG